MEREKRRRRKRNLIIVAVFVAVNILGIFILSRREASAIDGSLTSHAEDTRTQFEGVMDNYERSFQLFVQMMRQKIEADPGPDAVLKYLKGVDSTLLDIEGGTYDGLYMYYQGRYLYSWDTPYSIYEESGYEATERPWYKDAVAGGGEIVFTPPYMSYANHYILTTISQLQPDGETVFAYDIKMGDIQALVSSMKYFDKEQIMIFDVNGTVIGSTNTDYLGGDLKASLKEIKKSLETAENERNKLSQTDTEEVEKAEEKVKSAAAFYEFREGAEGGLEKLLNSRHSVRTLTMNGTRYYGYLLPGDAYEFLVLVPAMSAWKGTVNIWLVPLLILELFLIYVLGRIAREHRNRELRFAYVQLGQTQKRLEIALSVAQKAAAVDDLTGMMNFKSFRKELMNILESMDMDERGILIMIDGDRFKQVNDNYGHNVGDEVIKLTAQMIVGRIRTVDLASRLHGDEFAIFVSDTSDYAVAEHIMEDINRTIAKEAKRRNMPSITLSSGAVIAKGGDTLSDLTKKADEMLYKAKETHDGKFACEQYG